MKLEVYAIYDSAVGAFNRPVYFRSRGEAIRSFQDAAVNDTSGIAAHPEHYELSFLGYWSDDSARFENSGPERVCGGLDFVRSAD